MSVYLRVRRGVRKTDRPPSDQHELANLSGSPWGPEELTKLEVEGLEKGMNGLGWLADRTSE